jgi:hypothetical protein
MADYIRKNTVVVIVLCQSRSLICAKSRISGVCFGGPLLHHHLLYPLYIVCKTLAIFLRRYDHHFPHALQQGGL